MKKVLLMICLTAMLLALTACGQGTTSERTGGWTIQETAEISPEAQAAFDKAFEGLVGVRYTPLALLGTQLVSGTNYSFLCEALVVYPDAQPYFYAIASVYQNLQGEAEILNVVALNLPDIYESGEIRDVGTGELPLLGGWTVEGDSAVDVDGAVLDLASQVVAGKNHCVLCKGWTLCFVYEDLEGKTEILKTVPIDIAVLSQPSAPAPEESGAN